MATTNGGVDVTPADTMRSDDRLQEGTVMKWLWDYFWVILISCIILVSAIISITMVCVCRTHIYRRFSQRLSKSFAVRMRHNGTQDALNYESSIYQISSNVPPVSSRDLVAVEGDTCYSYAQGNLFMQERHVGNSANQPYSGYVGVLPDGDSDYDDAIIAPSIFR
ncbi:SLP adapter and CSK-interacting membrane protein [Lissotriton helveticus]